MRRIVGMFAGLAVLTMAAPAAAASWRCLGMVDAPSGKVTAMVEAYARGTTVGPPLVFYRPHQAGDGLDFSLRYAVGPQDRDQLGRVDELQVRVTVDVGRRSSVVLETGGQQLRGRLRPSPATVRSIEGWASADLPITETLGATLSSGGTARLSVIDDKEAVLLAQEVTLEPAQSIRDSYLMARSRAVQAASDPRRSGLCVVTP